jgi:hypothetical protein
MSDVVEKSGMTPRGKSGLTRAQKRAAAAAHSREYRKRRRRGEHCVTIRLTTCELHRLEELGYLTAVERQDRQARQGAVEMFVSDKLL